MTISSSYHKQRAEELIGCAEYEKDNCRVGWQEYYNNYISLAQVHAILATVPDEIDHAAQAKLGPL